MILFITLFSVVDVIPSCILSSIRYYSAFKKNCIKIVLENINILEKWMKLRVGISRINNKILKIWGGWKKYLNDFQTQWYHLWFLKKAVLNSESLCGLKDMPTSGFICIISTSHKYPNYTQTCSSSLYPWQPHFIFDSINTDR